MLQLTVSSAEFWMVFVYLNCMLAQLFIYCYFGTQVKYEVTKEYLKAKLAVGKSLSTHILKPLQRTATPIIFVHIWLTSSNVTIFVTKFARRLSKLLLYRKWSMT